MHPSKRAQIAHLKSDKVSIKVSSKYADFADVFSPKLAVELFKYIEINNYAIELVDNQQLSYDLIYSLSSIELKTFKVYIENNLANNFIKPFKSPAGVSIIFDKKPNGNLRLYVDYQNLNNLTIKN